MHRSYIAPMRSSLQYFSTLEGGFFCRWALLIFGARFSSCLRDHQNWENFLVVPQSQQWPELVWNLIRGLGCWDTESADHHRLNATCMIGGCEFYQLRQASCSLGRRKFGDINAPVSAGITCSINFSYQRTHCLSDDVTVGFVSTLWCRFCIYVYI